MTNMPTADEMPNFDIASCKGLPTDWWYPSFPMNKTQMINGETAKQLCRDCQIQSACLEYSLKWEPIGVWGGKTEKERHAMRRNQRILSMRPTSQIRGKNPKKEKVKQ